MEGPTSTPFFLPTWSSSDLGVFGFVLEQNKCDSSNTFCQLHLLWSLHNFNTFEQLRRLLRKCEHINQWFCVCSFLCALGKNVNTPMIRAPGLSTALHGVVYKVWEWRTEMSCRKLQHFISTSKFNESKSLCVFEQYAVKLLQCDF